MTVAVVGIAAWLSILVVGTALAMAAKRGDEIAAASRSYLPSSAGDARIVSLELARAARRISRAEQLTATPMTQYRAARAIAAQPSSLVRTPTCSNPAAASREGSDDGSTGLYVSSS